MELIQLARGKKFVPPELTGITATTTSNEYNSKGHNAIIIYVNFTTVAGTYSVKLQGKSPDGAFMDMYDNNGNLMTIASATADKAQLFVGIPDNFKIVSTEDTDGGTLTISYELLSV